MPKGMAHKELLLLLLSRQSNKHGKNSASRHEARITTQRLQHAAVQDEEEMKAPEALPPQHQQSRNLATQTTILCPTVLTPKVSAAVPPSTTRRTLPFTSESRIIIIIINPCKPYLTASAPRLTHWGGGK
jgi:hypothetical protein